MANPNPSPATRIKPGEVRNPGGKTSAQRKAEVRAAEKAALIQADLIDALANVIQSCEGDPSKLEYVNGDVHRLLEAVQDRAHGKAKQSVDVESPNGTMTPKGLGDFYADISTESGGDG